MSLSSRKSSRRAISSDVTNLSCCASRSLSLVPQSARHAPIRASTLTASEVLTATSDSSTGASSAELAAAAGARDRFPSVSSTTPARGSSSCSRRDGRQGCLAHSALACCNSASNRVGSRPAEPNMRSDGMLVARIRTACWAASESPATARSSRRDARPRFDRRRRLHPGRNGPPLRGGNHIDQSSQVSRSLTLVGPQFPY